MRVSGSFAPIVLKNSKIVGLQKSRECRMLANSATARPCGMDKSASSRFCGDRCGPLASKRLRRTSDAENFRSSAKKDFFNTIRQKRSLPRS